MTIEKMQAQLDKMKDDIEHMKVMASEYEHMISVIKTQDDAKFERVPDNEPYYTLFVANGAFDVYHTSEDHWDIDNVRFDNNNYFKTSERAQEVADKINFLLKLERFHDAFCPDYVPDWNDNAQKHFVIYDHDSEIYKVSYCISIKHCALVFFPSEEIAQKVCDILNKECENNDKS